MTPQYRAAISPSFSGGNNAFIPCAITEHVTREECAKVLVDKGKVKAVLRINKIIRGIFRKRARSGDPVAENGGMSGVGSGDAVVRCPSFS